MPPSKRELFITESAVNADLSQAIQDPEYLRFTTDVSFKLERRAIEKELNTRVQQISATQAQIRQKSQELTELMGRAREGAPRTHAYYTFAKKLVLQCEVQVCLQRSTC